MAGRLALLTTLAVVMAGLGALPQEAAATAAIPAGPTSTSSSTPGGWATFSPTTGRGTVRFTLREGGPTSAGVYDREERRMVHGLWSGVVRAAGNHSVAVSLPAWLTSAAGSSESSDPTGSTAAATPRYEVKVVGAGPVRYTWEGVLGNTGPLNGPGALRGLDPIADLSIRDGRAVWCVGYNERQPGCFSFHLETPQASSPVSFTSFERDFTGVAFDGELAYLLNSGGPPTSNNYYHLNETFVMAYNLSRRSTAHPNLYCMHNWTDPGAQTETCTTHTSQPTPPFHCRTDGCISTSDPPTWLALDFERRNATVPRACNSNETWFRACNYASAPSGIAVQTAASGGRTLLVAHAYADRPEIRAFDKVGGRSLGALSVPERPGVLALAADEASVWSLLGSGRIARFALPLPPAGGSGRELASVTGLPTACAIRVHPRTNALWVADRASQAIRIFPAAGGANGSAGRTFGGQLGLSFPYIPDAGTRDGNLFEGKAMACATFDFAADGAEVWISDPGNRRVIRCDVATEAILDTVSFLLRFYTSAVDWTNTSRVFANFLEYEVDYSKKLSPSSGWAFVRNWGTRLPAEYHAAFGTSHWPFAGFHSIVTIAGHTLAIVDIMPSILRDNTPDGSFSRAVELMADGTLRTIADFVSEPRPRLHPDGSLRYTQPARDPTGATDGHLLVYRSPFNVEAGNWTSYTLIANITRLTGYPQRHYGSGEHPILDVAVPGAGDERLLMVLDGGNSPNFTGFHLAGAVWNTTQSSANATAPSQFVWGASPGGTWNVTLCNVSAEDGVDDAVFEDWCILSPDGSLDRCGGHFPCGANNALTAKGHVIYGFNGEGWRGCQANQWLHFDALTGLFLGQFGRVNGARNIPGSKYDIDGGGYSLPGAAGNSFSGKLVTRPDGNVYLYHNDESAHGGVHRWHIENLDAAIRIALPLTPLAA